MDRVRTNVLHCQFTEDQMTVGRNDTCACGSGRKFKNCCIGKRRASKGMIFLLCALLAVAAAGVVSLAVAEDPGPAPAGKVWSAEHGHWHDA